MHNNTIVCSPRSHPLTKGRRTMATHNTYTLDELTEQTQQNLIGYWFDVDGFDTPCVLVSHPQDTDTDAVVVSFTKENERLLLHPKTVEAGQCTLRADLIPAFTPEGTPIQGARKTRVTASPNDIYAGAELADPIALFTAHHTTPADDNAARQGLAHANDPANQDNWTNHKVEYKFESTWQTFDL